MPVGDQLCQLPPVSGQHPIQDHLVSCSGQHFVWTCLPTSRQLTASSSSLSVLSQTQIHNPSLTQINHPKSLCTVTISCSDYLQPGSKPDLKTHAGFPLKPLVSQEDVDHERLTVHEPAHNNMLSEVWRGSSLRLQMRMGFAANLRKTFLGKRENILNL